MESFIKGKIPYKVDSIDITIIDKDGRKMTENIYLNPKEKIPQDRVVIFNYEIDVGSVSIPIEFIRNKKQEQ